MIKKMAKKKSYSTIGKAAPATTSGFAQIRSIIFKLPVD
jgi:hypothetical protein